MRGVRCATMASCIRNCHLTRNSCLIMPANTSKTLPRVVIEDVSPSVDGGRYPAKRSLGDPLTVGANIFKDGHDLIGARVRYRRPDADRWRIVALSYDYGSDRWLANIDLDCLGRWQLTVEAWPDDYGTWRADLDKRLAAGQDVRSELLEGAAILRSAKGRSAADRAHLKKAAARLVDVDLDVDERLAAVSPDALPSSMSEPLRAELVTRSQVLELIVDRPRARFGAWYELFPRSQAPQPGVHGTFADTERRLPELAELGFDVIYLPPVHPIGRSYRKGANNSTTAKPGEPGSPWAIGAAEGGHTAVHPELGTLADFDHLVDAARQHDLEIALDFALQCSPDHPWTREHPEWFFHRPDGTIRYAENPPKKYQDIYPINFWCENRQELWDACRDILLFWIDHGVRIFRVDNPHTKPFAFWEWCLQDIQAKHPDVVFLAEAFTRPNRMLGLAKLGFSQSYTYFTWKNHSWEIQDFMKSLLDPQVVEYYRPNFFANTPDILHEYLQHGGPPAFRTRLILAATLSPTYGIYSGFELCWNTPVREGSEEYLDSEKYQIRFFDWDAPGNLKPEIKALNRIRRENPALQRLDNLEFLDSSNPNILWYRKRSADNDLLIAVNLSPITIQEGMVALPDAGLGIDGDSVSRLDDLLTGITYEWRGPRGYVRLDPAERQGHVFRLQRPST